MKIITEINYIGNLTVTELFTALITATPKKLNIADIIRAGFNFIHLVTVTVEIAFGASVKPLTKTTARVRITAVKVKGEKPLNKKSSFLF